MFETANEYLAAHPVALKTLTVELPDGRTYRVMPGHIFLSSTSVAHKAAQQGLCRAIDWDTDQAAPVSGDKQLFERHRGQIFRLPYDGARLAVKIEPYKEPPAATVFHAFPQRESAAPVIRTGFEY
jgi:hypothetical protein